jgi:restriction system protein
MATRRMSFTDAAVQVLTEAAEPLHYKELCKRILEQDLIRTTGETPEATLNSVIAVEIKRKGRQSRFTRVKPGVYDLRGAPDAGTPTDGDSPEPDVDDSRVRTPYYPKHSEVRLLLPVWTGVLASEITGLRRTLQNLMGTPQNPVDWSKPDEWIPERLDGDDRKIASAVWEGSGKKVTPRHTQGHWLLMRHFGLMETDATGALVLTERGRDFLKNPGGETEAEIDEVEGLLQALSIIADKGPAKFGAFVEPWSDYLLARSNFGTDSTIKDTLRRRLVCLLDRGLLDRSSLLYSTTEEGLAYMERVGTGEPEDPDQQAQIRQIIKQHTTSVRETLQEILSTMDPIGFEHLVKRLLEAMEYDNVQVTSPANDGGVDVIADIELGITSVREVVQAKRHKKTIQRRVLDALRGSLHRFDAVRGTIITTSRFTKGTTEAAFERGAAPITLIDGEKLIDLLIEHGIGVRKRTIEVLEVDAESFAEFGAELGGSGE